MSNVKTQGKNKPCQAHMHFSAIEHKKMEWASALNALMIHSGKTRSEMASFSNISRGRITRILSGESNLTLETILKFSLALGYDVDIAFYKTADTKPYQPWNKAQAELANFRRIKAHILAGHISVIKPIRVEILHTHSIEMIRDRPAELIDIVRSKPRTSSFVF